MFSRLIFRRQFILSSQKFDCFDDWHYLEIKHGFNLSVHPDLELSEVRNHKARLIAIGFLLDPFSPQMNNLDILNDLITHIRDFEDLIARVEKYSGRWVIIYQDDANLNIFHDPCGQRQVYYHFKDDQATAASSTSIIHHFFHLESDQSNELKEFIASHEFQQNENKWIGDGTAYLQTKHLMPNYYLDLMKRRVIRYWPAGPLGRTELKAGVIAGAEILEGTIIAASKRKKLALAVTAGMDSRMLLAASRAIKDDVTYYVSMHGTDFTKTPDFYVPDNLFKKLDIPFYIQECNNSFSKDIKAIYTKNIKKARTDLIKSRFIYQHLLESQDKMIVNGNAGEIFRISPYLRPLPYRKATASNFAKEFLESPDLPYVAHQMRLWLKEVRTLCKEYHLDLYGMCEWEQVMGNWGALYPSEQDIAVDQLSPFNNRLLIRLMMSVDVKYRVFPKYILFKKMIEMLWPETLSEPINPKSIKGVIRIWGRHLLIKYTNGY